MFGKVSLDLSEGAECLFPVAEIKKEALLEH